MAASGSEYQQILRETDPVDIWADYRDGKITAETRNKTLSAKAKQSVNDVLDEKGYMGTIWQLTMEHLQDNWDSLVRAAQADIKWREENPYPNLISEAQHNYEATKKGFWPSVKL